MGRQDEIVKERLRKITELRKKGINPYVASVEVKNTTAEIQEKYKKIKNEEQTKDIAVVAGRLTNFRDLGKIAFGVLDDGVGHVQVLVQDDETPQEVQDLVKKYIDVGDFISVKGRIMRTKRGELSILIKALTLLTKSMYQLPDKWHGLQDDEDRLRKRYLDILMSAEIRERFVRKSKFWQTIRTFLLERGFLEVETPILENTPGGAEARPFLTHHNALNTPVYLRISPELWLKRLMVAGYPKVFEIGRIFRNEGMDAEHLQDYTQMEFYWGYADYNDGMKLVEEMYKRIVKEVYGKTKFKIKEFDVDFEKQWKIYDYVQTIKKMTGIDVSHTTLAQVEIRLKELKVEYDKKGFNLTRGIDSLWKHCRKSIAGPGFLINVPVMMEPLAKRMEKNSELVERFQVILAGSELGKGFSELNDPIDQLGRFDDQAKLREQGDEEAQMKDDEFVEALKYGMPPTCGFGVSERLFSFLEGLPIRECVIFPLMKPLHALTEEKPASRTATPEKKAGSLTAESLRHTFADAQKLMENYVVSESLRQHSHAVAAAMRAYARRFGAEEERWAIAGLLHDFDYEKHPQEHPKKGVEILTKEKYPADVIDAILGHAHERTGKARTTILAHALFAVDELTGIITALSKVRPGGFVGMGADSVEKALKKKGFASGVSREDINAGIQELGVNRKEHFEQVIAAVKSLSEKEEKKEANHGRRGHNHKK